MSQPFDHAAVPDWTFGWRLQRALDFAGLKHADLMERFEVSRGTITRWCRDVGPQPKKFILNEIAVMCGVSSRWLINGESPHPAGPEGGDVLGNGEAGHPTITDRSSQGTSGVIIPFPQVTGLSGPYRRDA